MTRVAEIQEVHRLNYRNFQYNSNKSKNNLINTGPLMVMDGHTWYQGNRILENQIDMK